MNYFILPHCCIAAIGKNAHSAIAQAILRRYYPEIWAEISGPHYHYPEGHSTATWLWQSKVPRTQTPDRPVLALLREPLERFLSGLAWLRWSRQVEISVEAALTESPFELWPQAPYLCRLNTIAYAFDRTDYFCAAAQLEYPLPHVNVGVAPKPVLADADRDLVWNHYADDFALYEQLQDTGGILLWP